MNDCLTDIMDALVEDREWSAMTLDVLAEILVHHKWMSVDADGYAAFGTAYWDAQKEAAS